MGKIIVVTPATHWREVIDTDKPAADILALYEAQAGDRSLPLWLMDNDAAGGCIGRVDYQAVADSLRSEAVGGRIGWKP